MSHFPLIGLRAWFYLIEWRLTCWVPVNEIGRWGKGFELFWWNVFGTQHMLYEPHGPEHHFHVMRWIHHTPAQDDVAVWNFRSIYLLAHRLPFLACPNSLNYNRSVLISSFTTLGRTPTLPPPVFSTMPFSRATCQAIFNHQSCCAALGRRKSIPALPTNSTLIIKFVVALDLTSFDIRLSVLHIYHRPSAAISFFTCSLFKIYLRYAPYHTHL